MKKNMDTEAKIMLGMIALFVLIVWFLEKMK